MNIRKAGKRQKDQPLKIEFVMADNSSNYNKYDKLHNKLVQGMWPQNRSLADPVGCYCIKEKGGQNEK